MKNNIIELTTLSFSHHDQIKFAEFSGDKNPIHINQKIAKKTIAGECIVHAVNLILTALEFYLTNSNLLPTVCRVRFVHPVRLGKPIRLVSDKDRSELRWETNISTPHCVIKIENQQKGRYLMSRSTPGTLCLRNWRGPGTLYNFIWVP